MLTNNPAFTRSIQYEIPLRSDRPQSALPEQSKPVISLAEGLAVLIDITSKLRNTALNKELPEGGVLPILVNSLEIAIEYVSSDIAHGYKAKRVRHTQTLFVDFGAWFANKTPNELRKTGIGFGPDEAKLLDSASYVLKNLHINGSKLSKISDSYIDELKYVVSTAVELFKTLNAKTVSDFSRIEAERRIQCMCNAIIKKTILDAPGVVQPVDVVKVAGEKTLVRSLRSEKESYVTGLKSRMRRRAMNFEEITALNLFGVKNYDEIIWALYNEHNATIGSLAQAFKVSKNAMSRRLKKIRKEKRLEAEHRVPAVSIT